MPARPVQPLSNNVQFYASKEMERDCKPVAVKGAACKLPNEKFVAVTAWYLRWADLIKSGVDQARLSTEAASNMIHFVIDTKVETLFPAAKSSKGRRHLKPVVCPFPKEVKSNCAWTTMMHGFIKRNLDCRNEELKIMDEDALLGACPSAFVDFLVSLDGVPLVCEWSLKSHRHRISDRADAVAQMPDGTLRIYEWKVTDEFNEKSWFKLGHKCRPNLADCTPSSRVIQWAIQVAQYRKLAILKGHQNVSSTAFVCVFSPTLNTVTEIELDLTEMMGAGTAKWMKVAVRAVGAEAISPIQFVEVMFHQREMELIESHRVQVDNGEEKEEDETTVDGITASLGKIPMGAAATTTTNKKAPPPAAPSAAAPKKKAVSN